MTKITADPLAVRHSQIMATMERYPHLRQQFLGKLETIRANDAATGMSPLEPSQQDAFLQDAVLFLTRLETRQRRTTMLADLPERLLEALTTAGRGNANGPGR